MLFLRNIWKKRSHRSGGGPGSGCRHHKKDSQESVFLNEGDIASSRAFVTHGCFRTYNIDVNGVENVLSFAVECCWIGDCESLESRRPSVFNIDSVENSEVAQLSEQEFETFRQQIPAFNFMAEALVRQNYMMAQHRIHEITSLSAENRYFRLLKVYPQVPVRVPQAMIASYLRITPETLSRSRKETKGKR